MDESGAEMIVSFDRTRDPVRNLIREEELFQKVERRELPELARLWVNSECLVKGRAKSARYGWYDEELARKMNVRVVERATGGGVVYHDAGNLNWSFFFMNSGTFPSPEAMFGRASKYVVEALGRLRVRGRFSPPNRIDVSGRKVSGMAARSTSRALLIHGTLLLNSDLARLNRLCIPPPGCPPVANISEWAKEVDASRIVGAIADVLRDSGYRVRAGKDLE